MGSYLVFDGNENNSKTISYAMADIMRIIKEESHIEDEHFLEANREFKISQKGLAKLCVVLTKILEYETLDDMDEESWFVEHEVYQCKNPGFVLVVNLIYRIWTESLCQMILYERNYICAKWE